MGPASELTPAKTAFFAAVVGVLISNVFASQVLVPSLAAGLDLSPSLASLVPTVTSLGYALGLFLVVPLADVIENRRLVMVMVTTCAAALLLASMTASAVLFLVLSVLIGASASLIQILVPLVGAMVPAASRGRTLGNVMSGLLLGIMISRPTASLVGDRYGWRALYMVSAVAVALLILPLRLMLPVRRPQNPIPYAAAVASLIVLVRREAILRRNALTAALVMGAFNVFWTAIAAHLAAPPFALSARGIALFGLVATAGAVAAPIMGRLGDRGLTRPASIVSDLAIVVALFIALVGGGALGAVSPALGIAALAVSAFFLDCGVVGDQTLGRRAINLLDPSAIGRRNGAFVGIFFLGGAAGSAVVGPMSALAGWTGVCLAGAAFGLAALLVSALTNRV